MALDYTDRTSNVGDRKEVNENRGADIATGAGAGKEAAQDQDRAITLRALIAARRVTPRPTTVSVRRAMSMAAKASGIARGSALGAERRGESRETARDLSRRKWRFGMHKAVQRRADE